MLVSFVFRDSVADRPMSEAVSPAGPEQANDRGSTAMRARPGVSWIGMDDASRKAADAKALPAPEEQVGPQESARLLGRYGRRFTAGETLFHEGSPAVEAFLVHDGRVRLLKRVAMADRSLAVLKEGDLFGEAALIEESTYGSTGVGLTDGVLLALDRKTFRGLLEKHPMVAARVIDQLVRRMRDAEDQIETMMLRGVQSRVTSALLKLAGRATGGAEVSNLARRALGPRRARRRGRQADRPAPSRPPVRAHHGRTHRDPRHRRPAAALHAAGHERRPRGARDPMRPRPPDVGGRPLTKRAQLG